MGLTCLDVVNVVSSFPLEDTDQRSVDFYSQRGGNASNSCSVLTELGEPAEYFGTLADGCLETDTMIRDFREHGIPIDNCPRHPDTLCPYSTIIVNSQNGSRTIIHTNKNLPELTAEEFDRLDLSQYSWIHFEGRNTDEVIKMISMVEEHNKRSNERITVSVEVEKVNRGFEALMPWGDVVFVSKDIARFHGVEDMEAAVIMFR